MSLNRTIILYRIDFFKSDVKKAHTLLMEAKENKDEKQRHVYERHIKHCKSSISALEWVLENCDFGEQNE